jgi:hypothetical protein
VEVRIVKGSAYREPENTQSVLAALRARLGEGIQIDLRFCQLEELERNPVGKIRQCFNRLSPERLRREGVFRVETVERLRREHDAGLANHSHVLWSLMVFEDCRGRWGV